MNNPIKHHFIPQFLLKRFCDANMQLHSFNKIAGKINQKKYAPAAVCYEENLHTLIHRSEKLYEIEKFYSLVEGEFSKVLKLIDEHITSGHNLDEFPKTDEVQHIIALFLATSFWRIPSRYKIVQGARRQLRAIYDGSTDANRGLLSFDRKFIRDLEKKHERISSTICQFIALPALLGNANNSSLQECWFYSSNFDLVISDDPIICDWKEDYSFCGGIYLPIGSRLCITNMPGNIETFQRQIFKNAKKIVMAKSNDCFVSLA